MTNETRQPRDEREAQGGELSEEQMEGAAGGQTWLGKARGDRAAELSDEQMEGAAGGLGILTKLPTDASRAEGTATDGVAAGTKAEGAAGGTKTDQTWNG